MAGVVAAAANAASAVAATATNAAQTAAAALTSGGNNSTAPKQRGGANRKTSGSPERREKPVQKQGVTGVVKWFNVVNRYGFIQRSDVEEDIFVHQTAIAKWNIKKLVASLGDGEEVLFDVVEGENGPG